MSTVIVVNAADTGDCELELASGSSCTNTPDYGFACRPSNCLDGILTPGSCGVACDASGLLADASSVGDCTNALIAGTFCTQETGGGYLCSSSTCSSEGVFTPGTCTVRLAPIIDLAAVSSPYSGSITGNGDEVDVCGSGPEQGFSIVLQPDQRVRVNQASNTFDSKHTLRYGGSYPGESEVSCVDDPDLSQLTYTNDGSTQ